MTDTNKVRIIGALAIIIAAALWGLDGVVLTPRLSSLDVGFVVFMLHLIPFLLMNFLFFKEYHYLRNFNASDYGIFLAVSLTGGVLGTMALVKVLFLVNFDRLSLVILLQKLQPIFAIILASLLLKEKLKKNFMIWATIAIGAGYFLNFGWHLPDFQQNTGAEAAMYAIIAALSYAAATVIGKKIVNNYKFTTATFYRFGFTTIIMTFYILYSGKFGEIKKVSNHQWLIFIIITFTTGSGALFLFYYGLTRVKAMISTICELALPVSAIFFDYIFNDSKLSMVQWISAAVMVGAITIISLQQASE